MKNKSPRRPTERSSYRERAGNIETTGNIFHFFEQIFFLQALHIYIYIYIWSLEDKTISIGFLYPYTDPAKFEKKIF